MSDNCTIGIFDSGVGGFSVLKEVKKNTNANIIYYGDSVNAPYGNRSKEDIVSFIKNIILHLKSQKVTHFVSACNSMSVHTTKKLLKELDIKNNMYVDMVTAIDRFMNIEKESSMLIIGTQATINSGVYQEILSNKINSIDIFVPKDLAQAIEENNNEEIKHNVKNVLNYAHKIKATHILYACTHYPLIHNEFENYKNEIGWNGESIDPAAYVAKAVNDWNIEGEKDIIFQTSKMTPVFETHIQDL